MTLDRISDRRSFVTHATRATHVARVARAALVALLAASLVACRSPTPDAAAAEPPAAERVAVRLAPIARGPVARPVRGTGVVRLKSETDLSFKVGGVVTSVLVDEGARIRKGQLLARVDPTEVDAALRQAREASAKAERDLERVRRLHTAGALPVAELENAQTGASLARAGVDAAAFNVQRSAIIAPDDGRVDKRMIEPGEVVAPGRPVFHVSGRSRGAVVRVGLVDRDVLGVRLGDAATVHLDARPGAPLRGSVEQIATIASPGSGTFDVEVKLAEIPDGLLSGLTAKVEIAHVEDAAATVPVEALVDGRGADAAVFVTREGRARKLPVKVAFLTSGHAALGTPLTGDDAVVAAGTADLADGTPVRVLP